MNGFRLLLTAACAAALSCGGCVTAGRSADEPRAIGVRNGTTLVLRELEVRVVDPDARQAVRFGQFSAVPPGSLQYVRRRDRAPALPGSVEITWRDQRGARHAETVNLAPIKAAGGGERMLVFEILPDGSVQTYLDSIPQF